MLGYEPEILEQKVDRQFEGCSVDYWQVEILFFDHHAEFFRETEYRFDLDVCNVDLGLLL